MIVRFLRFAPFVVALVVSCLTPMLSQASWMLYVGTRVQFDDGLGSGPGGEFKLLTNQADQTQINGPTNTFTEKFRTFCVQRNEFLNFSNEFLVQSVQGVALAGGNTLKAGAGALYSQFTTVGPNGFGVQTFFSGANAVTYDTSSASDANLLQDAIWHFQGQTLSHSNDATDNKFIAAANGALSSLGGSGSVYNYGGYGGFYGGVNIVNLLWNENTGNRRIGDPAQDVLSYQPADLPRVDNPVPEPATMLLFGLGALGAGFVRRRRV